MELKITPQELGTEFKSKQPLEHFYISTGNANGAKSHNLNISVEDAERNLHVTVYFNRNQATFIMNFIKSFLEETEIDHKAQD